MLTFLSLLLTDHTSGNSSLDTLLALLQAEGAKIEEETEVNGITTPLSVKGWPNVSCGISLNTVSCRSCFYFHCGPEGLSIYGLLI